MSEIQFLASSRPFVMPQEIEESKHPFFQKEVSFSVWELDEYWVNVVRPILTLPYLYEARGLGNEEFWMYIENHMELGDVFELYSLPVQHWHESAIRAMLADPKPITINIGSLTYENEYGVIKLSDKNWLEDLKHRRLVTEFGITTMLKY